MPPVCISNRSIVAGIPFVSEGSTQKVVGAVTAFAPDAPSDSDVAPALNSRGSSTLLSSGASSVAANSTVSPLTSSKSSEASPTSSESKDSRKSPACCSMSSAISDTGSDSLETACTRVGVTEASCASGKSFIASVCAQASEGTSPAIRIVNTKSKNALRTKPFFMPDTPRLIDLNSMS